MCSLFFQTTCNEVEGLLLVVEGSLGMAGWGGGNKVQGRLSMVHRGRSRGRTNKVKSRLGIVDRSWSRCRANKVQGRLGVVDRSGAIRGGNKSKLCVLVCLPFRRSLNLDLPLATTSSGGDNCLPLSKPVQLLLGIVPTSSSKRSNRWSDMSKLCVFVCLPFWGANNLDLSLATPSSGSDNSLLLSQPVQLLLGIVPTSSSS